MSGHSNVRGRSFDSWRDIFSAFVSSITSPGGQRNLNIISNIIACLHNNILCPLGETINQCIGPFSGNSGGGSLKKRSANTIPSRSLSEGRAYWTWREVITVVEAQKKKRGEGYISWPHPAAGQVAQCPFSWFHIIEEEEAEEPITVRSNFFHRSRHILRGRVELDDIDPSWFITLPGT